MLTTEQRLAIAVDMLAKAHGYVQAHAYTIGGQKLAEEMKAFVHAHSRTNEQQQEVGECTSV